MASRFKSNELFRLPTGIRKTTIPFYAEDFHGDPEDYDFGRQTKHYKMLRDTLASMGLKFTEMGASNITPARAHFTLYVGARKSPLLIWEKYEGLSSAGAQNRLYIRDMVFKMSEFAAADQELRVKIIEPCELRLLMRRTLTTEEQRMQHG